VRKFLLLFLVLLLTAAAGCDAFSAGLPDPAATLAVEKMPLEPEPPTALRQTYTLYFPMANRYALSGESRLLTVEQPGRIEDALIAALLKGPGATQNSLRAVINPSAKLVSVTESRDNLYVTFSKEFLDPVMPELDDVSEEKRKEIRNTMLRLAAYSVVNTVTELGRYTRVQILIDMDGSGEGTRPTRAEMGFSAGDSPDGNQLLNPLPRNLDSVYSPSTAAAGVLTALLEQDWYQLVSLIALSDPQTGQTRVDEATLNAQLVARNPSLMSYTVQDSTCSSDGQTAVVLVDVQLSSKSSGLTDIPLRFLREDGAWKLTYASLELLLNHVD
jgi:hypothetical protein